MNPVDAPAGERRPLGHSTELLKECPLSSELSSRDRVMVGDHPSGFSLIRPRRRAESEWKVGSGHPCDAQVLGSVIERVALDDGVEGIAAREASPKDADRLPLGAYRRGEPAAYEADYNRVAPWCGSHPQSVREPEVPLSFRATGRMKAAAQWRSRDRPVPSPTSGRYRPSGGRVTSAVVARPGLLADDPLKRPSDVHEVSASEQHDPNVGTLLA